MNVRPRQVLSIQLILAAVILTGWIFKDLVISTKDSALPAGWTLWRDPGAAFALALAEKGVYVGGMNGLFRMGEAGDQARVPIPGTKKPIVHALERDQYGNLWVGHSQGVSVRTSSGWKDLGEKNGLPHHSVAAILPSGGGVVWLGTLEGVIGIPYPQGWHNLPMKRITVSDGLLHNAVLGILEDQGGGLWFGNCGSPFGGLNRLEGAHWSHWTTKNGLPHPYINAMLMRHNGEIWIGCGLNDRGGAVVFACENGSWALERAIPPEHLAGLHTRSLFEDSRGRVWIGSEVGGLTIIEGNATVRRLLPEEGLPGGEITAMIETEDRAVWLGTGRGVLRIDPEAVTRLTH